MPAADPGSEIAHLRRDKHMPERQAVRVALEMARRGTFGKAAQRNARRGRRGR